VNSIIRVSVKLFEVICRNRTNDVITCRPVLVEVPHQASLHNREREVYVLRSDDGQAWHEHPSVSVTTDINEALDGYFQGDSIL